MEGPLEAGRGGTGEARRGRVNDPSRRHLLILLAVPVVRNRRGERSGGRPCGIWHASSLENEEAENTDDTDCVTDSHGSERRDLEGGSGDGPGQEERAASEYPVRSTEY